MMTKEELIAFEREIADVFEDGKIRAPVHLSKGNEDALIEIFKIIPPEDWVFSTWRSHYHALLHGVPPEMVRKEILDGNSITLNFPEYNFYTSAIVGGVIPIAVGAALALQRKRVFDRSVSGKIIWCFIGDMGAMTGIFHESYRYALNLNLPIMFVIENNLYSTNVPTGFAWSRDAEWKNNHNEFPFNLAKRHWRRNPEIRIGEKIMVYDYTREFPHQGSGKFVTF
jgi:TPP-dependent pyruvate/acetoin dehydrogenase alpha subunit